MARPTHQAHIHADVDVTSERLDAFSAEPRDVQVEVLATLRAQSADTSGSAALSLTGLFLAALLVIAAPLVTLNVDPSFQSNVILVTVALLIVVGALMVAFIPAFAGAAKDANRKERAAVWIGAYQDELARRHRLRGREARRWRRTH